MPSKFVVVEENGILEARSYDAGDFDIKNIVGGPFFSWGRAVVERNRLRIQREVLT